MARTAHGEQQQVCLAGRQSCHSRSSAAKGAPTPWLVFERTLDERSRRCSMNSDALMANYVVDVGGVMGRRWDQRLITLTSVASRDVQRLSTSKPSAESPLSKDVRPLSGEEAASRWKADEQVVHRREFCSEQGCGSDPSLLALLVDCTLTS